MPDGDSALFTHRYNGVGGTDAKHARLALGGLLALGGGDPFDVRTGVLHGPGSTTLVTGTADTAPMTVALAAHHAVTSRGIANGPYLGALPAPVFVDIGAAPGSGTRIDVVYELQADSTPTVPAPDATTGRVYGVLAGVVGAGVPDLSDIVGAEELATVAVSAGAVRTTDPQVLITNTARLTVARGADIPVRSKAERNALTVQPGDAVKRLDIGGARQWWDGTRWYGTRGDSPTVSGRYPNTASGTLASGAVAALQSAKTIPGAPFDEDVAYRIDVDAAARCIIPAGLGVHLRLLVDGVVIGAGDYYTNSGTSTATVTLKARDFVYITDDSSHQVQATITALAGGLADQTYPGRLLIEARPYTGLS